MDKTLRILSIDGGGIRGVVPARILAEIEKRTGKPAGLLFDMIAGTSTGGILALGLAKPGPDGLPQYSSEQLMSIYHEHGKDIFARGKWAWLRPLALLFEEKYPAAGLERVLEQYFGDTRLRDASTEVLITGYEIERRFPFFFRSRKAKEDASYDFPMKHVARATSAAPTYFEPLRLEAGSAAGYYALIDGGVFANNPAMCALVEAQATQREAGLLVSLGTGVLTRPLAFEKARKWGLAKWAKPVLDIALEGVASTVDYQLRHVLPRTAEGRRRYYRFQPSLSPEQERMDNASPENMRSLALLAEALVREHSEEIDDLCAQLTGSA